MSEPHGTLDDFQHFRGKMNEAIKAARRLRRAVARLQELPAP